MSMSMKILSLLLAILVDIHTIAQPVIRIDSSFNGIGYHTVNLNPSGYSVQSGDNILVNPSDKKYIVRGWVNPLGAYIKFNRDGLLDTTFNHTGILIQPGSERYTRNFFIDASNRLINAVNEPVLVSRTGFMRTLPNGTPDSTLDQDGTFYVPGPLNIESAWTPGPANTYYACGPFYDVFSNGSHQVYGLLIAKFKSDYTVDSSFGVNGIQKLYTDTTSNLFVNEVQFTSGGKIIIPYFYNNTVVPNEGYDAALFRLLPNGQPDPSFGINGIVKSADVVPAVETFWGCRILHNGNILGFGWYESSAIGRSGFLEEFLPDGKVDSSFGVFGRVIVPHLSIIYAVQEQRDGKLLISGEQGYSIVRLTADGIYDQEFGNFGLFRSAFSPVGFPFNLLLENDTTVLITGNAFEDNQGNNVTTARYHLDLQPMVTGVRSHYCLGSTVSGQVINYPAPDTTVTAFVDSLPITVSGSGSFSFVADSVGAHVLRIIFTKDTVHWKQSIFFMVDTVAIADILDTSQTICSYTPLYIEDTARVYWRSAVFNSTTPDTAFVFNGANVSGPTPVIAVRDNGGCGLSRDTIIINVINLRPVITASGSTLQTLPIAGATYQWYRNDSIIAGATQYDYIAPHNGTYTVKESLSGCSRLSPPYVATAIDPLQIPDVRNIAARYCYDANVQSGKLLNPPDTPAVITISQDGISGWPYYTADSTFLFFVDGAGTHTISVMYSRAGDTTQRDSSYFVADALAPGAAPVQNGNIVTAPATADSYEWLLNGYPIAGANAKQYTTTQSGTYSYTYTLNGCTSPESNHIFVTVTGIIDPATNREIIISPNPVTTDLYLQRLDAGRTYAVVITNMQGITCKRAMVLNSSTAIISLRELPGDVYVLSLYNGRTGRRIGWNKIVVVK